MSPSEFQLRAALHDGEGDGVDAGAVIARARAIRHTQRVRVASVAAAVVLLGGVGTGAGLLAGHSGHPTRTSAGSAAKAPALNPVSSTEAAPYEAAGGGNIGGPQASVPGPQCPATLPLLAAPGGGGTGQFGGTDQLLTQPVVSIQICGYGARTVSGALSFGTSVSVADGTARELAASLNNASTRPSAFACVIQPARALAIYAMSAGGALPVVTVHLDCRGTATNGTAVRYGWRPPADLAATIDALTR